MNKCKLLTSKLKCDVGQWAAEFINNPQYETQLAYVKTVLTESEFKKVSAFLTYYSTDYTYIQVASILKLGDKYHAKSIIESGYWILRAGLKGVSNETMQNSFFDLYDLCQFIGNPVCVRIYNAVRRAQIDTMPQFLSVSDDKLFRIRNLGQVSVNAAMAMQSKAREIGYDGTMMLREFLIQQEVEHNNAPK